MLCRLFCPVFHQLCVLCSIMKTKQIQQTSAIWSPHHVPSDGHFLIAGFGLTNVISLLPGAGKDVHYYIMGHIPVWGHGHPSKYCYIEVFFKYYKVTHGTNVDIWLSNWSKHLNGRENCSVITCLIWYNNHIIRNNQLMLLTAHTVIGCNRFFFQWRYGKFSPQRFRKFLNKI